MSSLRRHRWFILIVVLVLVFAIGTFAGVDRGPQTRQQRIDSLAAQIRCPTCAGLSVQQSDSPLATSAKQEIASEVDAGRSNTEIEQFFVSRYGDSALMSPARNGIASAAWFFPALLGLVAVAGVLAALAKWRRREGTRPTEEQRRRVEAALKS